MGYRTYTCPVAKSCGGCEWLAVPYPIQLRRKGEAIHQLFDELAAADTTQIDDVVGMDEPVGYRYKAATPFSPGTKGRIRAGFYARGTHKIVPCAACLVEHPSLRPILNSVARVAERLGVRAYEEDKGRGLLRHAIVRKALVGDDCLLTIVTNGEHMAARDEFMSELLSLHPEITSVVQNINKRRTNAMLGDTYEVWRGPGVMHDQLLGTTFEIGAGAFYQTNPRQTEVLYKLALDAAELTGGMHLLDAYCGAGTIGLCAAHNYEGISVTGVERSGEAVVNARRNARANHLAKQTRFVCADATQYLMHEGADTADVIILDPPRAGSTPEFLRAAAHAAPKRIVYVSCNPTTQLRDIELLRNLGYKLVRLTPVDMFAHTKHIETVAVLSRKSATKTFIPVTVSPKDMGLDEAKAQPTYENIRKYVKETHGLTVSTLNIAQMKAECGLEMECDRSGGKQQPKCPPEKREAILDAFRHFGMIEDDSSEG